MSTTGNDGDRHPKRPRLRFGNAVRVLVGVDDTEFLVHSEVIALYSGLFGSAMKRWEDVGYHPIDLSHESPATFDSYLHLLYHREINLHEDITETGRFWVLFRLSGLAHKLEDLANANFVVDMLVLTLKRHSARIAITWFANAWLIPVPSFRRLIIDTCVLWMDKKWVVTLLEMPETPKDLAVAIGTRLAQGIIATKDETAKRNYRAATNDPETLTVKKFLLPPSELSIERMHKLMAFSERSDAVPLYMEVIQRILRQMAVSGQGRGFNYGEFLHLLDQAGLSTEQQRPMKLRLNLLQSFTLATK